MGFARSRVVQEVCWGGSLWWIALFGMASFPLSAFKRLELGYQHPHIIAEQAERWPVPTDMGCEYLIDLSLRYHVRSESRTSHVYLGVLFVLVIC